jgi:hypothetical protein
MTQTQDKPRAGRDRLLLAYMTETLWLLEPGVLERLSGIVERHLAGVKLEAGEAR